MINGKHLIVVMGPSGCGKSTVAQALADRTSAVFIEGDDHHPADNKAKMASGVPLTDQDRASWLDRLIADVAGNNTNLIWLACSALSVYVQDRLLKETGCDVRFVLLDVPRDVLSQRLNTRTAHFMPGSLLQSQLDTLDPPAGALRIDATQPLQQVIDAVEAALGI